MSDRSVQTPVNDALIAMQRAIVPEEFWNATHDLMHAVMPARFVVLGISSLGIMPIYLRTTMPTRDIGRFGELAPLNAVLGKNPGLKVARMSDFYTPAPGDPFYEEFLLPDGWMYSAALLFWAPDGTFIGHLATLRSAEMGDYTPDELEALRNLHPHVEAAVGRLLALERSAATQISLERSLNSLPLPLAVATWDLELGFINSAAHSLLPIWEHGNEVGGAFKPSASALPHEIKEACLAIKESWSEVVRTHCMDRLRRSAQVLHPRIPGLLATVRLVEPPTGRALHPSILIHFQTGSERPDEVANALGKLSYLTAGERAVAILAASGHDNAEIARRLGRSTSTVRTHLRNIFEKLGITTRSRLAPLLRAIEVAGVADPADPAQKR